MDSRRATPAWLLPLTLVALLLAGSTTAQESPEAALTAEAVQAHIAAVESSSLDEPGKAAALGACREALEALRLADEHAVRAVGFEREASEAPARLEAIRTELAQPPAEQRAEVPPGATAAQVDQLVSQAEAELQASRRAVDDLRQEGARRVERRANLPDVIAKLKQAVAAQTEALVAPPAPDVPSELARARRLRVRALRRSLEQELRAAQAELASYDARQELLPLRRDRAQRQASQAEKLVAAWHKAASEVRRKEAERATEEARKAREEALRRNRTALELATENEHLTELRSGPDGLGSKIDRAGESLRKLREQLQRLRDDQRATRRRLGAAGLTTAMGLLLRRQYEALPDLEALERQSEQRLDTISAVQLELILLEEQREHWGDVDGRLQELLADVLPGPGRDELAALLRELVRARRDALDALVSDHTLYFNRLLELESVSRELARATTEYREFIEERILWVRSVVGSPLPTPRGVGQALGWLLAPGSWRGVAVATLGALRTRPVWWGAWLVGWLTLLAVSFLAKRELLACADRVAQRAIDSFPYTLLAVPLTLVAGLPLPAGVWLLSGLLAAPADQPPVGLAAANGLALAARFLLPLALVRAVVRPRGLGEAHFRWPPATVQRARGALRWFAPLAVTAAGLVAALDQPENPLYSDELGRLIFVVEMLSFSALCVRILGSASPVMQSLRRMHANSPLVRVYWAWFWLATLSPVALVVLAGAGYFYTAWELEHRLRATLWLLLGLGLISAILFRWLFLTRYRLVLEKARAAAEAAQAAAAAAPAAAATPPTAPERTEGGKTRSTMRVARAAVALAAAAEADKDAPDEPAPAAGSPAGGEAAAVTGEAPQPSAPEAPTPEAPPPAPSLPASAPPRPAEPSEDDLDIPSVSAQVQKLFGSALAVALVLGLWGIWADVLPALRLLDKVQLWPRLELLRDRAEVSTTAAPAEAAPAAPGNGGAPISPSPLPTVAPPSDEGVGVEHALPTVVTLADASLALLLLAFTVVLARNLPGLLEITLLQWLPLDGGARYALSTMVRYAITLFGVSLVLGTIGIGWAKIQWLAAALTFGLAFGLQEIFANFVSGLIILFEQPIRVGDVVTIGTVSGRVTRVRIRATTIVDWDRKELIIPNKTIVTGDVINWTLTDSTLRLVIPVGLAYGADTERALELLEQLGREQAAVLTDPPPKAVFLGFGDNSLALELRVFVPHVDHAIPVRDALHRAIDAAFRRAGLEIAFPQRDVHLRSSEPLRVVLER